MDFPLTASPAQPRCRLLYVGTDFDLLRSIQKASKDEGFFVVHCPHDGAVRVLLESQIPYDLLDEESSGASGIELVRLARALEHCKRTPIILLSLSDCAIAARRVGANKVLRKPDHLHALAETVKYFIR